MRARLPIHSAALITSSAGSLVGSVFGGRYSDHVFRKLKARNGGTSYAEVCAPAPHVLFVPTLVQMRLQSTLLFMPFLPLSVIAYGWVCEQHVNVAAICVMLFLSGLFSM